jgi:esterase/lipase superfamily enzyme
MSNLTFDEGLIREHAPTPLEGHTVVVLERVGEAGERFHSLLRFTGGRPGPGLLASLLKMRNHNAYFAFAVDSLQDRRLVFSVQVKSSAGAHEDKVHVILLYRVGDPRRLVSARENDPLRRVRDSVAEAVTSDAGALDLPALNAFARDQGIDILELRTISNITGSTVSLVEPQDRRESKRTERPRMKYAVRRKRNSSNPDSEALSVAAKRERRRKLAELIGRRESVDELVQAQAARGDEGAADPAFSGPPSRENWPEAPPQASSETSPEAPPDPSPESPPPPAEDGDVLYRVWYATNRRPADKGTKLSYGARIDERVHLGSCDVVIPSTHRMGELGSPWIRRFLTRTDDRLRLQAITPLEAEDFWSGVRDAATSYRADERHALVFIHGYRVSFKDAALRAAQLGYDLGIKGPVAFFSWPSRARVFGYPADGSAVEASEGDITDFLIQFAQDCGADRVHVIAHSMGNRPLLRALQRILAAAESVPAVRFGHLILAAPDVTRGLFLDVADQYRRLARRTTLYVSDEDNALRVSFRMQGDRVGLAPPVTCAEGIDTIHVGKVDRTMLGHSTFAEARPVLNDIHALLNYDAPPGQRAGLDERMQGNHRYWVFRA